MSCPRRLAGTALLARSGNASSNSISAFAATPRGLRLIGTIGSGGTDPDSVTIAGDHLVYVLNADSKTIAGFWLGYRGLRPIPGSVRPLGARVLVPRQIQFTSDARVLVVDEGGSSTIDTFVVGPDETPGPGGHHAEHLPAPRFIRPNELTVCGASHTETLCSRK